MANFLRALVSQTSLIIAMYQTSQQSNCAIDEHSKLLDAIELGDISAALSLMTEHLDHIEARLELVQGEQEVDLEKVFGHLRVKA